MLSGQTTVRQQEEAHHGRLYEADDFSKIIHFGIILLINYWRYKCDYHSEWLLCISSFTCIALNISLLVPFNGTGHSYADLRITILESGPFSDDTSLETIYRRNCESKWITTLTTRQPGGSDIRFSHQGKTIAKLAKATYKLLQSAYPDIYTPRFITAFSKNNNLKDNYAGVHQITMNNGVLRHNVGCDWDWDWIACVVRRAAAVLVRAASRVTVPGATALW